MRVLIGILLYPPDFTGAGFRIHRLYNNLKKKGIKKIYVITNCLRIIDAKTRIYDDMEIYYVNTNFKYARKQKKFINNILKTLVILRSIVTTLIIFLKLRNKIDIVHTIDSSWFSTLIGWHAFLLKIPLVKEIVMLGIDDPLHLRESRFFIFKKLLLFPFQYAKLIIAISPPLKDACLKYGLSEEKIWCRFNPVYLNDFTTSSESIMQKYLDYSARRLLWVGVIIRRKNLEFLLKSAYYLQGNVQLIMVGPREDENYFYELMSLSNQITQETNGRIKTIFLGMVDDRRELAFLYKNAHLFWFSSLCEGLGNVVIESLISGTPVIALPVNGIMKYLILDKDDGEVVDTNDPKYFGEIVNKALYNTIYNRDKIATRAKNRFNAEEVENEYLSKFAEILKKKRTNESV